MNFDGSFVHHRSANWPQSIRAESRQVRVIDLQFFRVDISAKELFSGPPCDEKKKNSLAPGHQGIKWRFAMNAFQKIRKEKLGGCDQHKKQGRNQQTRESEQT